MCWGQLPATVRCRPRGQKSMPGGYNSQPATYCTGKGVAPGSRRPSLLQPTNRPCPVVTRRVHRTVRDVRDKKIPGIYIDMEATVDLGFPTLHAARRTSYGASRLVQAISAWSAKTGRTPSWHRRDTRVYGHTTTAVHDTSTPRPPAACRDIGPTSVRRRAVMCMMARGEIENPGKNTS